ncbi:uncharacterized protein LOC124897991 [Capsicum annuum]|uniref:uncharacterized protein LOC124897991 n=1 Tax=Capsicum annuum TaxID=4072 RepID=UPI001FB0DBD4|nr:uncharacterized protein LOC124897991 [Capsicum annuum]
MGASVNLMPLAVCKNLGLEYPTPTNMRLVMADKSIKQPVGIFHDVLVKVADFILCTDFVVVDFDVYFEVPIILGWPLLATGRIIVDIELNELKFRLGKKEAKFKIHQSISQQNDMNVFSIIDVFYKDEKGVSTASEQDGSKKVESEQYESEHVEANEEDQAESKESESKEITFGSSSTEQQDDKESPPWRTLIKYLLVSKIVGVDEDVHAQKTHNPTQFGNRFNSQAKEMTGVDLAIFRAMLDKVKPEVGVLQQHQIIMPIGPAVEELEEEISILDLIVDSLKKKKKKLEFMADNEKWEAAIRARDIGTSSSEAPTTAILDALDGEKTADDIVTRSKTQDPRA